MNHARLTLPLAVALLATASWAPTGEAQSPLRLETVAQGLNRPIWVGAPLGDDRVFVLEEDSGLIKIVSNGSVLPVPFLDLSGKVDHFSHGGLLSMAFHPQYALNGHFFVFYSAYPSGSVQLGPFQMDVHLERYTVSSNPDVADPNSGVLILEDLHAGPIHKGGGPVFGPDGYLYVALGEGEIYGYNPDPCLVGYLDNWFGKILRIDIDGALPYQVPPDNPYINTPGARPEIFHIGLRSPWRMSFDRLTGDLYIGDVGNFAFEEVNFAPAGSGGLNFGYPVVEGSTSCDAALCPGILPACGDPAYTEPAYAYPNLGTAIIGGHVYRGTVIPDLYGTYVFADFPGGDTLTLRYDPVSGVTQFLDRTDELDPFDIFGLTSSLGEDGDGEILLTTVGNTGAIYRIVPAEDPTYCTSKAVSLQLGGQCLPTISGHVGIASQGLSTPFVIDATDILNGKAGFFFYGFSGPAGFPFQGGTMCVLPPTRRTPLQFSGGSPQTVQDCTGNLTFDFNAWVQSGQDASITPGQEVHGQFWFRVPPDPFGSGLTNAIGFKFGP